MCLWPRPGTARGDVEQKCSRAPRQAAVVLVSMQSFEQSTKTGLCGTDFRNSLNAVAQHM